MLTDGAVSSNNMRVSRIIKAHVVLNCKRYDTVFNKISNGKIVNNKPNKDVNSEYLRLLWRRIYWEKNAYFFEFVWREYYKSGHYVCIS